MGKKLNLVGEKYNLLTVIKEGEGFTNPKGRKYTTWICECECGNITEVRTSDLRRSHTKSCGCLNGEFHNQTSSQKTKEYVCWAGIKQRCLNSNDPSFNRYGKKGITMCDEWISSFTAFYDYVGDAPGVNHSLDRIDNSKGYEPGNVRWATLQVQNINKGISKRNTSGVKGVYFDKHNQKWKAQIGGQGTRIHLGSFDIKEEAIKARQDAEDKYYKPLLSS